MGPHLLAPDHPFPRACARLVLCVTLAERYINEHDRSSLKGNAPRSVTPFGFAGLKYAATPAAGLLTMPRAESAAVRPSHAH